MILFNRVTGSGAAAYLCWILALGAVALAFPGPEHSGAFMSYPAVLVVTAILSAVLFFNGLRAGSRRRFDSVFLHIGCACVLAGWLVGKVAVRTSSQERPASGYMSLVDGYVSNELSNEQQVIGKLPFSIGLMKFTIERYEPSQSDRDAKCLPPVREYSSRVIVTEPSQQPYVANVRVNHPIFVKGYYIYQMSWGQNNDAEGRPVTYTVLQFIRDPGLPLVYVGFISLFIGVLLFAGRIFRAKVFEVKESAS